MYSRPGRGRWLTASTALGLLLLTVLPLPAEAASSPTPIRLARYALDTATHASPAHVVTPADVLNAFETPSLNPTLSAGSLNLAANLGDLPGAARDIMVMNPSTYRQTCMNFPARVGASPTVVSCPTKAIMLWTDEPFVLDVSRDAIAAAAIYGRSVSGADVVNAARASNQRLASRPTFAAGRGGEVTFVVSPATNSGGTSDHLCVDMPRQRYGIPRFVSC